MKSITKLPLLALLVVSVLTSCSTDSMDDTAESIELNLVAIEAKDIEIEILNLINDYRLTSGLNTLSDMSVVKSVAYSHTDYMVDNNEVSHDNFFTRSNYLKTNVGATKVSENVAYGYSTAQTVVNAWLKSDGHRGTIEGDFTSFDVSAEKSENGRWYFTNIFIKK
ncbi:CAP domain-containing protein [Flavivirga aquimarina]|uniref:CAP domain-containing protein n=1 Tax=Flavivirga aquimarina TaxID=2027862 RepID=A0ABT8WEB4_9FLAO|nr:CAP domain-containing protein [Flavivirga aquimarina]MDO5971503.1 CAP domain-containing protein [Flavivirga aquimarina]